MRVDLRRLLDAMRRAMWRTAVIPGEKLRHRVDENGDHRIELVLPASEVEFVEPKRI